MAAWKKCVYYKGDCAENVTAFDHIQWKYLGQSMNFSANLFSCALFSLLPHTNP